MNLNNFRRFCLILAISQYLYAGNFEAETKTNSAIRDREQRIFYLRKALHDHSIKKDLEKLEQNSDSSSIHHSDEPASDKKNESLSSASWYFSTEDNSNDSISNRNHFSSRDNIFKHGNILEQMAIERAQEKREIERILHSDRLLEANHRNFLFEQQQETRQIVTNIKEQASRASLEDSFTIIHETEANIKYLKAEQKEILQQIETVQQTIDRETVATYKYVYASSELLGLKISLDDKKCYLVRADETLIAYKSKVSDYKNVALASLLADIEKLSIEQLQTQVKPFNETYLTHQANEKKYNKKYQNTKQDIVDTENELRSWKRWLNPFAESSTILNNELEQLNKQQHKEYINYSKAQQNKEIMSIAASKVSNLIKKKQYTIDWIVQKKADIAQNTKDALFDDKLFIDAMEKASQTGAESYFLEYNITDATKIILAKHGISTGKVTSYYGNAVQHYLHDKLVSELNIFSALSVENVKIKECINSAVDLNLLGQELNKDCHIDKAMSVRRASNAIFEYAKAYLELNLAVVEGMLDATIETVDDIRRIAELTRKTAYGLATDPEKTLEKIGAKLKEVKNACTQAVLAVSLISTDPEIRSRVLTDIYNTPTRDKVKSVVKISSELLLQTNILKSAIFVGSNTIDMAKFAQRRSKNILVAAQGFLESPHTVIAEEVSILLSETVKSDIVLVQKVMITVVEDSKVILASQETLAEFSLDSFKQVIEERIDNAAHSFTQYAKLQQDLRIKEFTSIINVTEHGLQRLIARGFKPDEILSIMAKPFAIQNDGIKVFLKEMNDGKYAIIMINEETKKVVTALKSIDSKSLQNLSKNYGWKQL